MATVSPTGRFTPQSVKVSGMFERRALRAATLVVVTTKWVSIIDRRRWQRPDPGHSLRHRGSCGTRQPLNRPQITFIGFTLERKGGRRLIELHQRWLGDRCDLLLVTTDSVERRPGVRAQADVRPGDGNLEEIFGAPTAFGFPSPTDEAPNVILEAMPHGVPIIAFRTRGIPEFVRRGVTGLHVDVGDDIALAAAIDELISHPQRAAAIGRAAREDIIRYIDVNLAADRLVNILGEARDIHGRLEPIG